MELNLEIANEISAKTPNLCHLAPAGPTYMEDLNEAGGVYAVMNELSKKGLLNLDCLTANGTTVGENIKNCVNKNPEVIRPVENPYSQTGGIAVLKGNLAPDSGVVKRSAVAPEMLVHEGPARVFDCEEDAIDAIKSGKIVAGDVVVIRYEGPKGGPGMREMLNPTSAIAGMGLGSSVALITDGRFSGASRGAPSDMYPLRQQWAARSHWWKRETSSVSISRRTSWMYWYLTKNWQREEQNGSPENPRSPQAIWQDIMNW